MANGQNARRAAGIINRMREPSTWAGFAIIAGLFGAPVAPDAMQDMIQAGTGIAAALAVFLPEGDK